MQSEWPMALWFSISEGPTWILFCLCLLISNKTRHTAQIFLIHRYDIVDKWAPGKLVAVSSGFFVHVYWDPASDYLTRGSFTLISFLKFYCQKLISNLKGIKESIAFYWRKEWMNEDMYNCGYNCDHGISDNLDQNSMFNPQINKVLF